MAVDWLIGDNEPGVHWITDSERKFKQTKSHIMYDTRIYIDVPYDAEDIMRNEVRELNDTRPLNQFDRVTDDRKTQIRNTQHNLLFLWIRYWCMKCIDRRTNVASFVTSEATYQKFFKNIMNDYYATKLEADPSIFDQFKERLKRVVFTEKEMMDANEGKLDSDWDLDSLIQESNKWLNDICTIKSLNENMNHGSSFRSHYIKSMALINKQKNRYCKLAVKEIKNTFQTKLKAQETIEKEKKQFEQASCNLEELIRKDEINSQRIKSLEAEIARLTLEYKECNQEKEKFAQMIPTARQELNQLKRDLAWQQELIDKCETLLNNYNQFNSKTKQYSNEIEKKREQGLVHFETNWYDWNINDILFWFKLKLNCLENNTTRIDFKLIDKNLRSQQIKSKYLSVMNRNDLKSLGFELFEHRCILHESIQQLIETYPIPSDDDNECDGKSCHDSGVEGLTVPTNADECNDKPKYDSKYLCPITKQLFQTPVIAYDGITYEKYAIIQYIEKHHRTPSQSNEIAKNEVEAAIAMLFPDDQMEQDIDTGTMSQNDDN